MPRYKEKQCASLPNAKEVSVLFQVVHEKIKIKRRGMDDFDFSLCHGDGVWDTPYICCPYWACRRRRVCWFSNLWTYPVAFARLLFILGLVAIITFRILSLSVKWTFAHGAKILFGILITRKTSLKGRLDQFATFTFRQTFPACRVIALAFKVFLAHRTRVHSLSLQKKNRVQFYPILVARMIVFAWIVCSSHCEQ